MRSNLLNNDFSTTFEEEKKKDSGLTCPYGGDRSARGLLDLDITIMVANYFKL